MSYVTRNLSKDEEVKKIIKLHWINYIVTAVLTIFAFFLILLLLVDGGLKENVVYIALVLFFVLWTLYNFLKLYTTERVITNKRVIYKTGIISVRTEELKNSKIESIEIKQTILGRILDYGTIAFSGTGTSKVYFDNVDAPATVKTEIDEIIGD